MIVHVAGEELELCAEKAVYWPRCQVLLLADPHFGKAASFRKLGVFVPRGTTLDGVTRIDALIERHDVHEIVFLGDFLHAREGRNADTFAALSIWRAANAHIRMRLVRGNHDKRAGDPPGEVGIECLDGPLLEGPFALAHHPVPVEGSYVLAGHVHPCAVLTGPARQRERLPCFHFGQRTGVLPAFGDFTGCHPVEPAPGDRIWVVAEDAVLPVTGPAL